MSKEAAEYFKNNIDKCIGMTDCEFAEAYHESQMAKMPSVELIENGWFDAYQDIDSFLFNELEKINKEFPIINQDKPEINTIEAIKLLINFKNKP